MSKLTGNSFDKEIIQTCKAKCLSRKQKQNKERENKNVCQTVATFLVKCITLWEKGWTCWSQSCSSFLECKHSTVWLQYLHRWSSSTRPKQSTTWPQYLHRSWFIPLKSDLPTQHDCSTCTVVHLQPDLPNTAQCDHSICTNLHFYLSSQTSQTHHDHSACMGVHLQPDPPNTAQCDHSISTDLHSYLSSQTSKAHCDHRTCTGLQL